MGRVASASRGGGADNGGGGARGRERGVRGVRGVSVVFVRGVRGVCVVFVLFLSDAERSRRRELELAVERNMLSADHLTAKWTMGRQPPRGSGMQEKHVSLVWAWQAEVFARKLSTLPTWLASTESAASTELPLWRMTEAPPLRPNVLFAMAAERSAAVVEGSNAKSMTLLATEFIFMQVCQSGTEAEHIGCEPTIAATWVLWWLAETWVAMPATCVSVWSPLEPFFSVMTKAACGTVIGATAGRVSW